MAEGVVVKSFRQKIADHLAGTGQIGELKYMAFGDGGHNSDLTPNTPNETANGLTNELISIELREVVQTDGPLSVIGQDVLETIDCVTKFISEAAHYYV